MSQSTPNWEQLLADAGLRVTRQRRIVLEAVHAGGGHEAIGDIYLRAKQRDPKIDRSTVYRALRILADRSIVLTASSGNGELLYEVRHATPHHHLVCRSCGEAFPLADDIAQAMVQQIRASHGFAVELDHLTLWGTCVRCAEKHATQPS